MSGDYAMLSPLVDYPLKFIPIEPPVDSVCGASGHDGRGNRMPSGLQRGLKGEDEVLSLVHGHTVISRNASGTVQACARSTSHRGAFSEA
jgi:hypothetical protein